MKCDLQNPDQQVLCSNVTPPNARRAMLAIDARGFLSEFVFVQSCLARRPLKLSSTILSYVDLTLLDADWGMWSRFFWLCSRPLISFETQHLLLIQSPPCTCGRIEMNLKRIKHSGVKQLHAGFCQEFETPGSIMPKRSN